MSKPDLDQMAAEYCAQTTQAGRWNIYTKMETHHGWEAAQNAIRRAREVRKLVGL